MHARPHALLTAIAAVTLVLAGCDEAIVEAHLAGKPASKPVRSASHSLPPQPKLAEMLMQAIRRPRRPRARGGRELPDGGFGGVQARIQQATDQAAAAGATLSVAVLDRVTHQLVSNGDSPIPGIASVAKLFIADDLLLAESAGKTTLSPEDRQAMDIMLQSSDDGAAEKFWGQDGGDVIVSQVASRYGLGATTPPGDGRWWNTISTAERPGPLLRHAARRGRWAAGGAGPDDHQRSGPVDP